MSDPIKFKRLVELATDLNEKLNSLQLGNLSAQELESMTENSRELYERLVVLRYKAFDNIAKENNILIMDEEVEGQVIIPITFKIEESKPENTPNQVSLIDVIEEVTKQEAPIAIPTTEEKMVNIVAENKTTEPILNNEKKNAEQKPQQSLYEHFSRGNHAKETLAERLEHNPIADLKRAISLNQRFQFSKELFKGNNQEYEVAIDKLNTSGREDALKHLSNLSSKYSWSEENVVTNDFVNLVQRRHQV